MLMPRRTVLRHRRMRWVVGQVGFVTAGVFCYFQVRGHDRGRPRRRRPSTPAVSWELEQAAGIDVEAVRPGPGRRPAPAYETVANWIYIWGHWPVILDDHAVARPGTTGMGLLTAAGLDARLRRPRPPRLRDVSRRSPATGRPCSGRHRHESVPTAYRLLQPPNFVNQYAAMPSLHAGWDLLVGHRHRHGREHDAGPGNRLDLAPADGPRGRGHSEPLRARCGCRADAWPSSATSAALLLERRRARRAPRRTSPPPWGVPHHDLAGDRTPCRELAGRPARGQPRWRRRSRVRRARLPRPSGGPSSQDGRAAAVPVGPLGAGVVLSHPAWVSTSCSRPGPAERPSCWTSKDGASPPGATWLSSCAGGRRITTSMCADGTGRAVEHVAEPVISSEACCPPAVASSWPHSGPTPVLAQQPPATRRLPAHLAPEGSARRRWLRERVGGRDDLAGR